MNHPAHHRIATRASAAWILFALIVVGCGGSQRTPLSGRVTLDGQPVPSGQIVFEPAGAGRMAVAQIANGDYATSAQQGPTEGSYVVRITANRPTGRSARSTPLDNGRAPPAEYQQYIPGKYNEQSELKADISREGPRVLDFALKSS